MRCSGGVSEVSKVFNWQDKDYQSIQLEGYILGVADTYLTSNGCEPTGDGVRHWYKPF